MAEDEMRRQMAFRDQPLRAVNIAQHAHRRAGALHHRRLDIAPVRRVSTKGTTSSCQGRAWPPASS